MKNHAESFRVEIIHGLVYTTAAMFFPKSNHQGVVCGHTTGPEYESGPIQKILRIRLTNYVSIVDKIMITDVNSGNMKNSEFVRYD